MAFFFVFLTLVTQTKRIAERGLKSLQLNNSAEKTFWLKNFQLELLFFT
jgi:hypothetical protein